MNLIKRNFKIFLLNTFARLLYIAVQGINLTFSNPDMYELGEIVTSIDASDPDVNEMMDRQ